MADATSNKNPAIAAGRRHSLMVGTPGQRHVAAIARGIAAGAIIAGSAAALYAERGTLRTGMNALWHARPAWVAAGAALEFASMAAFVLLQHGLLTAAGARPAFTWLLAADYASNAIATGVPIAGSGLAAATTLRQFRRHGLDPAAIRLTLGLAGVISTVGFAVMAAAGAVLTGNPAGAGAGLLTSCGSAAAIAFLVIAAHSPGGRARLAPITASALRLAQRIAPSSLARGRSATCWPAACSTGPRTRCAWPRRSPRSARPSPGASSCWRGAPAPARAPSARPRSASASSKWP